MRARAAVEGQMEPLLACADVGTDVWMVETLMWTPDTSVDSEIPFNVDVLTRTGNPFGRISGGERPGAVSLLK